MEKDRINPVWKTIFSELHERKKEIDSLAQKELNEVNEWKREELARIQKQEMRIRDRFSDDIVDLDEVEKDRALEEFLKSIGINDQNDNLNVKE